MPTKMNTATNNIAVVVAFIVITIAQIGSIARFIFN